MLSYHNGDGCPIGTCSRAATTVLNSRQRPIDCYLESRDES